MLDLRHGFGCECKARQWWRGSGLRVERRLQPFLSSCLAVVAWRSERRSPIMVTGEVRSARRQPTSSEVDAVLKQCREALICGSLKSCGEETGCPPNAGLAVSSLIEDRAETDLCMRNRFYQFFHLSSLTLSPCQHFAYVVGNLMLWKPSKLEGWDCP